MIYINIYTYIFIYIYDFGCMYVCAICMAGNYRGQKKASDHMELELYTVVGPGNQTQVHCRNNKCP